MKVFLEYIPLILFLIIYKMEERLVSIAGYEFTLGGIYSATTALIVVTVLVYGGYYLKEKTLTRMQWIVVFAVIIFGTSTLLLRSEEVLKWKAPAVNWLIAVIFLGSQFFRKENMTQAMFGEMVHMPPRRWKILNLGWVFTFFVIGTANAIVAFNFHEWWVDFKVFGSFALLLLAVTAQVVYIYPYLADEEKIEEKKAEAGEDSV